jgi:AAA domain
VPGLIAEGLNLLAGAPKLGKSWLALNVAAAVAYGGTALDRLAVERGEVLYLALEDPPRRLQRRLELVLTGEAAPDGLYLETAWPRLLEGGCELLNGWLDEHPACRLVVVDVFAKVRGLTSNGNVDRYEADYAAMSSLKTLADCHAIAILVVHHTRKASAEDYVDAVSGTHGLAGAADAVLVLQRSRGNADAKLLITGRDVEEAEYAMEFLPAKGSWALLEGPALEYELGETRRRILAHLRESGPGTPKAIAEALGLDHENVKKACQRMANDDQIVTDGSGVYSYLSPESPVSPEGQEGQEGQVAAELGSEMFPVLIANAFRNGHITEHEVARRYSIHKLIVAGSS